MPIRQLMSFVADLLILQRMIINSLDLERTGSTLSMKPLATGIFSALPLLVRGCSASLAAQLVLCLRHCSWQSWRISTFDTQMEFMNSILIGDTSISMKLP